MPRNTRISAKAESTANHVAFVLELLGSFFYVIAAVYLLSIFPSFLRSGNMITSAAGGFWLPLFYSVAIIGTVMLFVVSFTNLMKYRSRHSYSYGMLTSVITGVAWIGLGAGDPFLTVAVLIGFIASLVGSAFGMVVLLE